MSSSDLAVSIRGISKSYTLAHNVEKHSTLAETVFERLKRPLQRPASETFWALNDVSFDVNRGEVVGIVGRNGAGKSTLLKILSQITKPQAGQIDVYGRLSSLLEVGTGFHPELTGRENIFLNGAILGMPRRSIVRLFDEIVDFAGVEPFIDTPVKRYSSGMYVRLAFSVAAHLDSDILVVDEVLAVGDMDFQRKCLSTMQDVANSGRTVIFVSHNMPTIQKLCTKGVLLHQGSVVTHGDIHDVVEQYQSSGTGDIIVLGVPISLEGAKRWGGDGRARFTSATFFAPGAAQQDSTVFRQGDLGVRLELSGDWAHVKAVGLQICDPLDRKLVNVNTLQKQDEIDLKPGSSVELIIRDLRLTPGIYKVGFWMGAGEMRHIDCIVDHCFLEVLPPIGVKWFSQYDGYFQCAFDHRVVSDDALSLASRP